MEDRKRKAREAVEARKAKSRQAALEKARGGAAPAATAAQQAKEEAEQKAAGDARVKREAMVLKALANVRELSGLLPVCAWCHRMRDDEGYWQDVESFLARHTEVTHSICPECKKSSFG